MDHGKHAASRIVTVGEPWSSKTSKAIWESRWWRCRFACPEGRKSTMGLCYAAWLIIGRKIPHAMLTNHGWSGESFFDSRHLWQCTHTRSALTFSSSSIGSKHWGVLSWVDMKESQYLKQAAISPDWAEMQPLEAIAVSNAPRSRDLKPIWKREINHGKWRAQKHKLGKKWKELFTIRSFFQSLFEEQIGSNWLINWSSIIRGWAKGNGGDDVIRIG